MKKVKHALLGLGLIVCMCILSISVVTADYNISNINYNWEIAKPTFEGSKYLENPQSFAPYEPGKLAEGFLQDGLNMVNYFRFISGVPFDLELDKVLNEEAQYGAVLLAATGQLSHTPYKPDDMDEEFYKIGYKSTSSSNLSAGLNSIASSVQMYMSDSDSGNIDRVGHRRWILNPQMKKTGFGYADGYSVMRVFDSSRLQQFVYDYIAWPNKGFFPTELFNGSDAWSISLNPDKYDNSKISEIKVDLTSLADGKKWSFDYNDTDKAGKYFNVDTNGYGVPFCIIFRPNEICGYKEGDKFSVEISGVYDKFGQQVKIVYSVDFFTMENKMIFNIGSPNMSVNGIEEEIDPGRGTEPVIVNDRALLPIRRIVETIGGNIEWIPNENAIVIKLYDKEIKMWVGNKNFMVNGIVQLSDVEPQIINERTMVPIRAITENLGCQVEWNDSLRQITVIY